MACAAILGLALAPVVTAALASRFGWPAAFVIPGLVPSRTAIAKTAVGRIRRQYAFGTEYAPLLELATAMFVLYGLLSLPQSWLAARFGRRAMIAAYSFGTGLALMAAGLAHTPLALEAALAEPTESSCLTSTARTPSRPD